MAHGLRPERSRARRPRLRRRLRRPSRGRRHTGADPERSAPAPTTRAPDAVSAGDLRTCLTRAKVRVVGESETYTDKDGEVTSTASVEIDGAEYVGLAL